MPTIKLHAGEEERIVELTVQADGSWRAVMDGREVSFEAERVGNRWRIRENTQVFEAYVMSTGDAYQVVLGDEVASIQAENPRRPARKGTAQNTHGRVEAPMPAQVREVFVQVGQAVEKGAPLAILEAMKMEMRVTASRAGHIQQVLAQVGDTVNKGQLLFEIIDLDANE